MLSKGIKLKERYELLEIIGTGGMGEVWRALDLRLDREVAIKIVNSYLTNANPDAVKILLAEAKSSAKLIRSNNIVTILDFDIENFNNNEELHYIVMEYVEGITLSKWLENHKNQLDTDTGYFICLLIAFEICQAVQFAHKRKTLHRDIKPLNVFLSTDGHVKVGDFGLAKFVNETTRVHTMKYHATTAYAAPEQVKGEETEEETDIYQIGVTLYEIFSGKVPFEGENSYSIMFKHVSEEPKNIKEINPRISQSLADQIMKMLSKEKSNRGSLWEILDVISSEMQISYNLKVSIKGDTSNELKEKVAEITDFGVEKLGDHNFNFPDYKEALSEGLQISLLEIYDFQLSKLKK